MEPTTTEAVAHSISLIDLVMQGWYVTYPLIAMPVMVTSILIERLWLMRGITASITDLTESACAALGSGDAAAATGTLEAVMAESPAARVYAPLIPLFGRSSVDDLLE